MAGPASLTAAPPQKTTSKPATVREPSDLIYSVLLFAYAALTYVLLGMYLPDPGHARCALPATPAPA